MDARERRRAYRQRLERVVDRWDEWRQLPREDVPARMYDFLLEKVSTLDVDDPERLVGEVMDEVLGLGPLEPLLRDPAVSAIRVDGPGRVRVVVGGAERQAEVDFDDDDHLERVIDDVLYGSRLAGTLTRDGWWGWKGRLVDGSPFTAWRPPFLIGTARLAIDRPDLPIVSG
jgi:pilus assembly protein CpaF